MQLLGGHSNNEALLFMGMVVTPLYHFHIDDSTAFREYINRLSIIAQSEDIFTSSIVSEMKAYKKSKNIFEDKALLMYDILGY